MVQIHMLSCSSGLLLVSDPAHGIPAGLSAGAPKGVEFNSVKEVLLSLKAVKAMHSLHLWALTLGQTLLSVHVAIGEPAPLPQTWVPAHLGHLIMQNIFKILLVNKSAFSQVHALPPGHLHRSSTASARDIYFFAIVQIYYGSQSLLSRTIGGLAGVIQEAA